MKSVFSLLLFLVVASLTHAQTALEMYRKADAALNAKDYPTAASLYAAGIRTEGNNATIQRYRSAAASFAMAGLADSAFHYLREIARSAKTNRMTLRTIEYGYEFNTLHTDQRWTAAVAAISKQAVRNGYEQEELIYGRKDGMALTLIHIKPKSKSNKKAIIFVSSGGWVSGYNGVEAGTQLTTQYLAQGFHVFHVVHGSVPRFAIPDAVNDLKRAVRYIRYHANKLGIDPNKIGITGASAGGHLSLMIATAADSVTATSTDPVERVSARVQAAAVLFPPTDLLNWGGPGLNMVNAKDLVRARGSYGAIDFRTYNRQFNTYDEVSDTASRSKIAREVSPIYHVSSDDPPVFIIHGDSDATVPLQQSQQFINRLNELGVRNRFVVKKGGRHVPDDMLPEFDTFVNWFNEHLK